MLLLIIKSQNLPTIRKFETSDLNSILILIRTMVRITQAQDSSQSGEWRGWSTRRGAAATLGPGPGPRYVVLAAAPALRLSS